MSFLTVDEYTMREKGSDEEVNKKEVEKMKHE
jgi:hypothetical protein